MNFVEWMNIIESTVKKHIDLSLTDLPDHPYRQLFNQNVHPIEVAHCIIKEASEMTDWFVNNFDQIEKHFKNKYQ